MWVYRYVCMGVHVYVTCVCVYVGMWVYRYVGMSVCACVCDYDSPASTCAVLSKIP